MEHGDSASMKEQLQMVMTIKTEVDAAVTSLTHIDIEIDLNHIIQEPVQSVKSEPALLMNEKVLEDSSQNGNEQQSAQGASAPAGTHKLNEVCGNSLDYFRNIKQEPGDMDIGPIVVQHMDIHYAINKNPSAITEDDTIVDDCNEAMPGSGVKKESREDKMRGSLTPLKAPMKEWNAYRMLPNLQRTVHKERLQSICRVNLIRRDAFQCKFCGAAYAEHRWLLQHLKRLHGCHQQTHLFVKFCKTNKQQCAVGNKTIPCKYCCQTMTKVDYELKSCLGQQMDLQQRLMQQHRVMSSNNFKCDTCGRTFHEPHLLSAHKELHQQNSNKISLATKSVVAGPSNQAHIGEKLYNCGKCDAKFALSSQLTSHVKVHTGAKPYSCDMCDARFGRSSHLTSHVKVHTGEKPYQCNICNVRLTRKGDLNVHMRIHTGEKPYHCDICDARFVYSGHLKTHMRIHTGEKPYQCGICGKKFAHSGSLTSHMRVHTGEKPYECGMCDKRFTKSSNLTSHVKVHTGEKPYPCDLCDARFAHSSGLTAHLRGHTGEKPYSCDTCDARFARSTTLTNHMIVHTGEKPYQCDICDVQYARKYSLILHLRAHTRTGKSEQKRTK